jgi:hypothetical protein
VEDTLRDDRRTDLLGQWYPKPTHYRRCWRAGAVLLQPPSAGILPRKTNGAPRRWRRGERATRPRDCQRCVCRLTEFDRPRESRHQRHHFFGHSFIATLRPLRRRAGRTEGSSSAQCDPAIEIVRRNWPFPRDRRVDAYGPILSGTSWNTRTQGS